MKKIILAVICLFQVVVFAAENDITQRVKESPPNQNSVSTDKTEPKIQEPHHQNPQVQKDGIDENSSQPSEDVESHDVGESPAQQS